MHPLTRLALPVWSLVALSVSSIGTTQPALPAPSASPSQPQAQKQPRRPERILAWSAKPTHPDTWVAPNRPHWKLADILAQHAQQKDWSQTLVHGNFFTARYVSMGPGKSTQPMMYADDRVVWIVQSGQIRFTIDGQDPFVASQGFLVEVPYRTVFHLQTVGDTVSLRFEVTATGATPVYPINETPPAVPGKQYVKVSTYGHGRYDATNKPFLDFDKVIVQDGTRPGAFVSDDKTFVNVIRGHGTPAPPSTDLGHFHLDFDEFWFVLEGQIDYQIEGVPFFSATQGDIVYVPKGRWHRASSGGEAMSTRVAINPRPDGMHNFQPPD
jgi:mannose-6-phosphate isomerase-like protein (cupin superfamily)